MMNDVERKDDIPSTTTLSKLGMTAIGYTAGGIFLILLQVFSKVRGPFGLILGAIICAVGIGSFVSKDTADKKVGALITIAGLLTILSKTGNPVIMAVSGTILSIGTVGILALGIINGLKFLIGLKKRS